MSGLDPALLVTMVAAGLGSIRFIIEPLMNWLTDRAVRQERVRLAEMLGPIALNANLAAGSARRTRTSGPKEGYPQPRRVDQAASGKTAEGEEARKQVGTDVEAKRDNELAERFAPVLIEYYAYGLVRAKRHDTTSLLMSTLGGIITVVGVGNLILFARTGSAVTASATSSAVGILTNAIAVLFHRQAGQALKHMQDQTLSLRDDMRKETDSLQAVKLLDQVQDSVLRDRLRAGLVLRLSGAELPGLGAFEHIEPRLAEPPEVTWTAPVDRAPNVLAGDTNGSP